MESSLMRLSPQFALAVLDLARGGAGCGGDDSDGSD
jgi:hypothetical protein